MDLVYPRCAGIDVHKRTAVVTIGWVDGQGQRQRKTRTFGTMTGDIAQLAAWLVEHQVTHVAMESTGVYWSMP
jgi:transposase